MRRLASGYLRKMRVELGPANEARYYWASSDDSAEVSLNELLGRDIVLRYRGEIRCIYCSRQTTRSFSQGYCYPCLRRLARCDLCVVRPHTCHYHAGTCREPSWGEEHCMQKHAVYLSETSGLKIGLTRMEQIPTRWLDQGALAAVVVMFTHNRHQAGLVEHACSTYLNDTTQWRAMLRRREAEVDLLAAKTDLLASVDNELRGLQQSHPAEQISVTTREQVWQASYPVTSYPDKLSSVSFDKRAEISGRLTGIKGQYLMMGALAINVRKHSGYGVDLFVGD